jgi:hypothetical protein
MTAPAMTNLVFLFFVVIVVGSIDSYADDVPLDETSNGSAKTVVGRVAPALGPAAGELIVCESGVFRQGNNGLCNGVTVLSRFGDISDIVTFDIAANGLDLNVKLFSDMGVFDFFDPADFVTRNPTPTDPLVDPTGKLAKNLWFVTEDAMGIATYQPSLIGNTAPGLIQQPFGVTTSIFPKYIIQSDTDAAVPEPANSCLVAVGMLALILLRRKRALLIRRRADSVRG